MMEGILEAESMFAALMDTTKIGKTLDGISKMQKAGKTSTLKDMGKYFLQNKTRIGREITKLSKMDISKLKERFGEKMIDHMTQSVKGYENKYKQVQKKIDKTRQQFKDEQEKKTKNKEEKKKKYPPKRVISSWIEWVAYDDDLGVMTMKTKSGSTTYVFPFFPKSVALQMRETQTGAGTILWREYWHKLGSRHVAKEGLGIKQAANAIANNPKLAKLLKKQDPLTQLTKQFNKQLKGTGVRIPRPTRTKTGGIKWK